MVENVKCQCKCKKDNKTLCMQKDYAWNPGACAWECDKRYESLLMI